MASSTVGVVFLYLVCLLLPQMIWLLQNNSGFAVCESCDREEDIRILVKAFMSRRNTSSPHSTHQQPTSSTDAMGKSFMFVSQEAVSTSCHSREDDSVVKSILLLVEETDEHTLSELKIGSESGHAENERGSAEWAHSSLCSCGLNREDITEEYDDSDPNGGWETPEDYPDLSGPCNIRKVEVSTLTQREFEQWFAHSEPVVLVGLPEQLAFKAGSTQYRLLKDYGHDIITVATANTHSYRKEKMSLCEYVENMMTPQTLDHLGNETLYHFGDNNREGWSSLFSLYNLPPYHPPDSSPVLSFGLAGPGTGVPFHIHGPTFAETVYGRKRWFLYPPTHRPRFDPDQTTLHWLTHTYPQLFVSDTEKPLECTLNPGEVIYFPDKWWHATLNPDTAVFMSTFYS